MARHCWVIEVTTDSGEQELFWMYTTREEARDVLDCLSAESGYCIVKYTPEGE